MRARVPFALAWILVVGGCLGTAAPKTADPQAPVLPASPLVLAIGPLKVQRLPYDFAATVVTDSKTPLGFPVLVRGSVHFPEGTGPFPVLVFLHGRHSTCEILGSEWLAPSNCPTTPATKNVDSFAGYDYIAQPLASNGYVVISINANDINERDLLLVAGDSGANGRAQLILHTLDEFRKLNQSAGAEPIGARLVGKLDFGRVGLMGHSRGGEGVARAVLVNEARAPTARYPLKAVFALAPTDFSNWRVPNVPLAVLLPWCDGDVSDLQGARLYDDARYLTESSPSPKIQIVAMGSNHNYYNTVWTFDDGSRYRSDPDPHCGRNGEGSDYGNRRLKPDDQRRHGGVYIAAFLRAYVGGETEFLPLLDGRAPPTPEACPTIRPECPKLIRLSYHPGAPDRKVLEDALDPSTLSRNDLGGAVKLEGFSRTAMCRLTSCPSRPMVGNSSQLSLAWNSNATYRLEVPAGSGDFSAFPVFAMRVGYNFLSRENQDRTHTLLLGLEDAAGARKEVPFIAANGALAPPPGVPRLAMNQLQVPLAEFPDVDMGRIAAVEIRFTQSGSVQVNDLLLLRHATP